jgi:hypothetical protein
MSGTRSQGTGPSFLDLTALTDSSNAALFLTGRAPPNGYGLDLSVQHAFIWLNLEAAHQLHTNEPSAAS